MSTRKEFSLCVLWVTFAPIPRRYKDLAEAKTPLQLEVVVLFYLIALKVSFANYPSFNKDK